MVWSGDPLSTSTIALETWIDGKKYFDRAADLARRPALEKERAELVAKAKKMLEAKRTSETEGGRRRKRRPCPRRRSRRAPEAARDAADAVAPRRRPTPTPCARGPRDEARRRCSSRALSRRAASGRRPWRSSAARSTRSAVRTSRSGTVRLARRKDRRGRRGGSRFRPGAKVVDVTGRHVYPSLFPAADGPRARRDQRGARDGRHDGTRRDQPGGARRLRR